MSSGVKMSKVVYDTRFFAELFYSTNESLQKKIGAQKIRKERFTSAVVIHEIYRLALKREGRETAKIKVACIKKDFKVIPVDDQIAQLSAELRHKYQLSMGDSMIAATSLILKAVCISDDLHFKQINEIETTWI
jgi:predicted nucleic acid-binding protein